MNDVCMDEGNYKLHYLWKFQNASNQIPFHLKNHDFYKKW